MLIKTLLSGCLFTGLCLNAAFANTNNSTVTVKKAYLNSFLEKNELGSMDVHGVSAEEGTVTLIPNKKFEDYLVKNNFDFVTTPKIFSLNALDGYLRPNEVREKITLIAESNPAITRLIEVGTTYEGRSILGVEITDDFNKDKPVIVFNGMHHARELMTTEVVMSIAEKLTEQHKVDDFVTSVLRDFLIVVIPQVNPDGNNLVYTRDNWWRKNAWKNVRGSTIGVDLNRNYPIGWDLCNGSSGRQSSQTYRGPSPSSEPETVAMLDLFEKYRPIANISYHAYSEMIIYPFGCRKQKNTAQDLFRSIALDMKKVIIDDSGRTNTYAVGTAPELLYQADGTDLDTHWQNFGTLSYTFEVNARAQGFQPNHSVWKEKTTLGQEPGWKQLIKSVSKNAFKFVASEDFEYVIKTSEGESFAGKMGPTTFKARKGRVNFRPLLPGTYSIEIIRDGKKASARTIEITDGVLDLGTI